MQHSAPHLLLPPIPGRPPLGAFLGLAVFIGTGLACAAGLILGTALLPLAAFGTGVALAGIAMAQGYPHADLGACNAVTLVRAAMVAFLAGAVLVPGAAPWTVFAVASVAFALDGADGWLARRAGLSSDFGARFDMETDAALGAVLSLWLLASAMAGPEILLLGFMRYAFVLAGRLWPPLRGPLPPSLRRKAICVVQIAALLALVCPLTPVSLLTPVAMGAALALSYSFAVDILWLLRRAA